MLKIKDIKEGDILEAVEKQDDAIEYLIIIKNLKPDNFEVFAIRYIEAEFYDLGSSEWIYENLEDFLEENSINMMNLEKISLEKAKEWMDRRYPNVGYFFEFKAILDKLEGTNGKRN